MANSQHSIRPYIIHMETNMAYAINWETLDERINTQKQALLDTDQKMDPERLKFLAETYDECKGESVFITRARLFRPPAAYP